jgi:hypothetical protein
MTTLMNFIKIYQFFQNLIRGDRQPHGQEGDLINPLFFLEEGK